MTGQRKFNIPLTLVLVDGAGAILVAWGLYLFVGGGNGVAQIVIGLLLMAPLMLHFLRMAPGSARNSKEQAGRRD